MYGKFQYNLYNYITSVLYIYLYLYIYIERFSRLKQYRIAKNDPFEFNLSSICRQLYRAHMDSLDV